MHAKECGSNFIGLCDKMTSINGETLLNFLRNVSFTGKSNSFFAHCTKLRLLVDIFMVKKV